MRNVMRKTLVTVGIAVALAVGPGVGMANAAPLQMPTLPEVPDLEAVQELVEPIVVALFPDPEEREASEVPE
jgi:hypothetical protein